jgi:hypothetical protein
MGWLLRIAAAAGGGGCRSVLCGEEAYACGGGSLGRSDWTQLHGKWDQLFPSRHEACAEATP